MYHLRNKLWPNGNNAQDQARGREQHSEGRSRASTLSYASGTSEASRASLWLETAQKPASSYGLGDNVGHLLPTIQAMQNRYIMPQSTVDKISAFVVGAEHLRPEILNFGALKILGFTTLHRSREIISAMVSEGLAREFAMAHNRRHDPRRYVARLQEKNLPQSAPLTHREAQGLRLYLQGVSDNLHLLGQSIENLPASDRGAWFFYAEFASTLEDSLQMAASYRAAGILNDNGLPENGGERFQAFKKQELLAQNQHMAPSERHAISYAYDLVREALFPLPIYKKENK